jgi:hypothetical protein
MTGREAARSLRRYKGALRSRLAPPSYTTTGDVTRARGGQDPI